LITLPSVWLDVLFVAEPTAAKLFDYAAAMRVEI
jgi:hypothetical protein